MSRFHFLHPYWLLALPPLIGAGRLARAPPRSRRSHGRACWMASCSLCCGSAKAARHARRGSWSDSSGRWRCWRSPDPPGSGRSRPPIARPPPGSWRSMLSPSMAATDVSPSRIARARYRHQRFAVGGARCPCRTRRVRGRRLYGRAAHRGCGHRPQPGAAAGAQPDAGVRQSPRARARRSRAAAASLAADRIAR